MIIGTFYLQHKLNINDHRFFILKKNNKLESILVVIFFNLFLNY